MFQHPFNANHVKEAHKFKKKILKWERERERERGGKEKTKLGKRKRIRKRQMRKNQIKRLTKERKKSKK